MADWSTAHSHAPSACCRAISAVTVPFVRREEVSCPRKLERSSAPKSGRRRRKRSARARKRGEQYVGNTKAAREARKEASAGDQPIEGYYDMTVEEAKDQLDGLSEGDLNMVRAYKEVRRAARPSSNSWTEESGTVSNITKH
jgi:hypothetical protein